LRIEVEDQADGPHHGAPTTGSGLALQTLRKRLKQQYDGEAHLELSSMERGTLVTLELPKHTDIMGDQG
jgi:LytS/YehU family sensor histidine kinase